MLGCVAFIHVHKPIKAKMLGMYLNLSLKKTLIVIIITTKVSI